ncbi:hypothetical protein J7E62_32575 [Variovorax paradoxus]|nr:hypothetical protein [Variovorax paradoxus]
MQSNHLGDLEPAVEKRSSAGPISLSTSFSLPLITESAEWSAQPVRIDGWNSHAAKHAPAARLQLDSGAEADLHIEVDQSGAQRLASTGSVGKLLFLVPLPSLGQLRALDDAHRHIALTGQFIWIHQPDVQGLAAAAQQRLDARIRGLQKVEEESTVAAFHGGTAADKGATGSACTTGTGAQRRLSVGSLAQAALDPDLLWAEGPHRVGSSFGIVTREPSWFRGRSQRTVGTKASR